MLPSILFGFCLGLAVSIINYQLALRAYNKLSTDASEKFKKKFTTRLIIRYILNFVVLFLVHKNVPMLIATAFGLTMVKNYLLLQYTLGKKGVS
ncbi:MAG: hypothetical protein PWQ67_1888 [Clostridia bacterium]|jgi:hypothetical protein|nr:hypothetical protein [Clostridia bacterium]MDN5323434.1 hypothetical protein [Clostridia bacterium]